MPHTEVKRLLDLVRSVAKPCETPIPDAYQPFNQRTQDGREMGVYSDLLTAAIRSIVQVREEKELDSLFTGQKTTALTGPATGLDDFELIAFLVVEPVAAPRLMRPPCSYIPNGPAKTASCPRTKSTATRNPAVPFASALSRRWSRSSGATSSRRKTVNLPARPGVEEIQVFEIALKTGELEEDVLRTIDRAIPSLLFFELTFKGKFGSPPPTSASAKQIPGNSVVEEYFETPWQARLRAALAAPGGARSWRPL